MRALLARRPEHAEFYAADHPLHGLKITATILREFAREAERRVGRHGEDTYGRFTIPGQFGGVIGHVNVLHRGG